MLSHATIRAILGAIEVFGGLVMLWATFKSTTKSGFSSTQARWAMVRRGLYCILAFAMFARGVAHIDGDHLGYIITFWCQTALIFGLVFFPLLRAMKFISQDTFHFFDLAADPPER